MVTLLQLCFDIIWSISRNVFFEPSVKAYSVSQYLQRNGQPVSLTNTVGKPTKSDKKKGKATLVNLLGYSETLIFAKNLKKKIDKQIKKYGSKASNLLESVEFILTRKF